MNLTTETGELLTPIDDAPGYARGETGRVWSFGHPRKGPIWVRLRPTREIEITRTPGHVLIRRTGRFFFPIFRRGLPMERLFWTPPDAELPAPAKAIAEDDDDCPF